VVSPATPAGIGVLTMDNTLISRAAVQSEFRKAVDLLDRIGGGAGLCGREGRGADGIEHVTIQIRQRNSRSASWGRN
jgi:hypothetical protein